MWPSKCWWRHNFYAKPCLWNGTSYIKCSVPHYKIYLTCSFAGCWERNNQNDDFSMDSFLCMHQWFGSILKRKVVWMNGLKAVLVLFLWLTQHFSKAPNATCVQAIQVYHCIGKYAKWVVAVRQHPLPSGKICYMI